MALPYCDACVTTETESPSNCVLVCTATARAFPYAVDPYAVDTCMPGASCKPLSDDADKCDNGNLWPPGVHACQLTGNCGVCTYD